MTRIIHMRGDVTGMLILFVVAFLGIWQFIVAILRLNGLSITGYPDRSHLSKIIGAVLFVGSCSWYFSKPGHFASPDVEGIETLILLLGGLVIATVLQTLMAGAAGQFQRRGRSRERTEEVGAAKDLPISIDGVPLSTRYRPGSGDSEKNALPVLLLHDCGGRKESVSVLAARLAAGGHAILAVDLEGHGGNPRAVSSAEMVDLLDAAAAALRQETGEEPLAAVGVGFGGLLAMDLVARGVADRAVAIDPPARDKEGCAWVNVFRELGPFGVIAAFFKPPARGHGGKHLALNKLLEELPVLGSLPPGKVTIIGTSEKWFNSPVPLTSFAEQCGVPKPILLPGNHASIADREETVEATLLELASDP